MHFWVKLLCSLQGACLSLCHARETPGGHAGLGFWVLGFWGIGVVFGVLGISGK